MINIHIPTSLVGWKTQELFGRNWNSLRNSLRQLKEEVETNRAALAQLERRVQRMRVGTCGERTDFITNWGYSMTFLKKLRLNTQFHVFFNDFCGCLYMFFLFTEKGSWLVLICGFWFLPNSSMRIVVCVITMFICEKTLLILNLNILVWVSLS